MQKVPLPPTCPVCRKPLAAAELLSPHRPFCSLRCRQIDLMRWLDGKYAIVEPLDVREFIGRSESSDYADDE